MSPALHDGTAASRKLAWSFQMNHSIHSADRATHLKIVVIALVAGIAVAGFGISARIHPDYGNTAQVIKAGKPVLVTRADLSIIR